MAPPLSSLPPSSPPLSATSTFPTLLPSSSSYFSLLKSHSFSCLNTMGCGHFSAIFGGMGVACGSCQTAIMDSGMPPDICCSSYGHMFPYTGGAAMLSIIMAACLAVRLFGSNGACMKLLCVAPFYRGLCIRCFTGALCTFKQRRGHSARPSITARRQLPFMPAHA